MSVRLCKDCYKSAVTLGALEQVLNLCRNYCWLCPENREQCGAVNGTPQKRLRDEIVLQMVASAIAETRPEKMN